MSGNAIFVLREDGTLVEMNETAYKSEDLLQTLVEKYPDLLAGKQMSSGDPRRWLLVSREMPVPDDEASGGRWSLDHLFLDQDGIPTLIEVKRSSDTRIRREVIGQMLDYAANAVLYWPVEEIRAHFDSRCEREGLGGDSVLREFLGMAMEPEEFWATVKTNLQAEKIRLVFVADTISSELQRIVEFLNGQMDPAEVVAVEIKQYTGKNLATLVPRVVGQTAEAKARKEPRTGKRQWDESSFFADLSGRVGPEECNAARRLLEWANASDLAIKWGQGKTYGTFYPMVRSAAGGQEVFGVSTSGKVEVVWQAKPDTIREEKRMFLQRLNAVDGVDIPDKAIDSWGSFALNALRKQTSMQAFLEACEEFIRALDGLSGQDRHV